MTKTKIIRFIIISLLFFSVYSCFLAYQLKVLAFFTPQMALALSALLTICFIMTHICYSFSVFRDPGFVDHSPVNPSKENQRILKEETFKIVRKVTSPLLPLLTMPDSREI